jgi:hypothetical protein
MEAYEMKNSLIVVIFFFLLLGCANIDDNNELVLAARASERYAKEDGVNLTEDQLISVIGFQDMKTSVMDVNDYGEYSTNIRKNLKNKDYWEACYSPIDDGFVGGGRCFYLNKGDFVLLGTYRSR